MFSPFQLECKKWNTLCRSGLTMKVIFKLLIIVVLFTVLTYSQYNFLVEYSKYANLKFTDCSQVCNWTLYRMTLLLRICLYITTFLRRGAIFHRAISSQTNQSVSFHSRQHSSCLFNIMCRSLWRNRVTSSIYTPYLWTPACYRCIWTQSPIK